MFTYNIPEDFNEIQVCYFPMEYCYNVRSQQVRNYLFNENDSTSPALKSNAEDGSARVHDAARAATQSETDNLHHGICRKD